MYSSHILKVFERLKKKTLKAISIAIIFQVIVISSQLLQLIVRLASCHNLPRDVFRTLTLRDRTMPSLDHCVFSCKVGGEGKSRDIREIFL